MCSVAVDARGAGLYASVRPNGAFKERLRVRAHDRYPCELHGGGFRLVVSESRTQSPPIRRGPLPALSSPRGLFNPPSPRVLPDASGRCASYAWRSA